MNDNTEKWIGVDLDGTLANYESGMFARGQIGAPIPLMVNRVQAWLREGREVRLLTVRVHRDSYLQCLPAWEIFHHSIGAWMRMYIGRELLMQCFKDHKMEVLYDDKAIQVEFNTGAIIGSAPAAAKSSSVPDILEAAAATYRKRNAIYGDNYKNIGAVMMGLFPEGLRLETPDDWNRLALVMTIAGKLGRYTAQQDKGGHLDSAHDASVYAAMLEEITAYATAAK